MIDLRKINESQSFEAACCTFYEDTLVQMLLGTSFHPGGLDLTKKLGDKLQLKTTDKILDLASGLGTSALCLSETFGCNVVGIDVSAKNVAEAQENARKKKLDDKVTFKVGSVEKIPLEDNTFDYVLSECSFCLFDKKETVGSEIYRLIKPKGKIVITDIAIEKPLPFDLDHIVFKVACIANAVSMNEYADYFKKSGFTIQSLTRHDEILLQMVEEVKKKLFVLELASGLHKIHLAPENVKEIKTYIQKAKEVIQQGYTTYMILIGRKF